jgi:succinate-semialdehyde dehydrogenase/glutarate-semialdehyde dehydrogenase
MRKMAAAIMEHADELATIMTLEQGKPLAEARGEVVGGAATLEWYAEDARRINGEIIPGGLPGTRIWLTYHPVGVVGAITPWNFPSAMITRKIAPAIAAGCTVVLKPAEQTPVSAIALADIFHQAGLPAGVFNVVACLDPVPVGDEFLNNHAVRKISFTGSTEVGKLLMAGAARQVKHVSMELGGHAPFIVFEDADLDLAVASAFGNKFVNAGQTCVCANRIYVHASLAEAFADKLAARAAALVPGDGMDAASTIGPLIENAAVQKVHTHVEDARSKGATVVTGGEVLRENGMARGNFYAPTVLLGVRPEMRIATEETFGPVAPVISFTDEEEVIAAANNTRYGLAAYLFTNDINRATRVSDALQAGMIAINSTSLTTGPQGPFGGIKESGMGREGGTAGLYEFLEMKTVSLTLR